MNILDALDDPALFAPHFRGESWRPWRAFLTALFALPDEDGSELYHLATGRQSLPEGPFTEAALIVGRRGGKSRVLALIAVYLAVFRDYAPYLAPGEVATIAVLAANRSQARSIFRYVSGLLKAVPLLAELIEDEGAESITLSNRVVIEIGTASFRTTRGYSFAAVLCDEIAFWRQDETSANPDVEILRALRPGMASIPGSILLLASSPYAKRGELYAAFRRHFGKDDARVLVWKADTATMNPRIDPAIIAEAYQDDPESARAEYGAEFRDDLADFVTREIVEAVTAWGRAELPPEPGVTYAAFCDPSGGANDAMTLAVAHLRDGEVCVLDAVVEVRPPFDPERAVAECASTLRRFGITRVIGDRYAGEWPKARFREHGIDFEQSARPKSDLYHDLLPLLNAKRVELLEHPRLAAQLVGLERRTARSGRDSIDHTPGGHDDLANAAAGVLVGLDLDRRPALVRQSDILQGGEPLPLPSPCKCVLAVLVADTRGMTATLFAATTLNGPRLLILDYDVEPLHGGLFETIGARLRDLAGQCRARAAALFVPQDFVARVRTPGLVVNAIPEHLCADDLLLPAAAHIAQGNVKICTLAQAKAATSPFGAALDFRAAESAADPLRQAALLAIALTLDPQ
ncbi:hypothetical+protein [Methylocapsa aurea]|uniref:hypothetical protein n=1 Tax=Methylocapsa aurea TaxID=663610 RepID=UPI003D18E437